MMGPLSRTVLISLAALGSLSTPVAFASDTPAAAESVAARRQQASREAMQELQEARLAYSAKRYSEAVEHYRRALLILPKSTATEKQQRFIRDSLSDALIAKAIDYRKVGRKDEAVEFLEEAIKLSPNNQRASLELAHTHDAVRTNPALSPQHVAEVEEVSRLLTLAYGQLDLGRYDEAIETFQSVRRYDAYNTAAQRGMEQARKRKLTYFQTAHDSARAKALADVDSTWEEELPVEAQVAAASSDEAAPVQSHEEGEYEQAYADTLSKMMLPQIIFEKASVGEIMETLQNQIRRYESEGQGASRAISILANFGAPDSDGYKELMNKRVTFNLTQVSVRDVLDLLTRQLGITYYYTPLGVELSYSGADFGPLIERTFTVPPHFFDAGEAEEEDEEEDAFGDSSPRVAVRRVNPMDVFKEMGISFPEGALARYMPSTRTLHVRNTAHNIEAIKDALNVPIGDLRQILLNVVIMEVSENDLEELGFDWLLQVSLSPNGNFYGGGGVTQAASTLTGLPLFAGVRPEEGSYMTEGLRTGARAITQSSMDRLIETGTPAAFMESPTPKAPGIFSLRGVWNAADLSFIMRGLSQKKGTDMLQNPQLVLSPGAEEQVTFANVREMFYPEEYEEGELITASGRVVTKRNYEDFAWDDDDGIEEAYYMTAIIATGSHPSSFVRFGMSEEGAGGIGAILQVHTAEVTENNHVKLDLTTTVNDFEGFINWGTPITTTMYQMPSWDMVQADKDDGDGTYSFPLTNPTPVTLSPNRILKPVFKRSMVNTSVVVEPGSVLVFAGLKDAKKVRYEDKVPVLGDLPLVGRFFRSSGEQTERKALLYFARVDLVDPSGRDVNTGEKPTKLHSGL